MRRFKVFAAVLLISSCSRPEREIRSAVEGLYAGMFSGQEHNVAGVEPVTQTDTWMVALVRIRVWEGNVYSDVERFAYLTRDQAWRAQFDLDEDFRKALYLSKDHEVAMTQRMAQRIAEMFRTSVKVNPGLRKEPSPLIVRDQNVYGSLALHYQYPKTSTEFVNCLYTETYRFTEGRWDLDTHRLLEEKGGRTP